MLDSNQFFIESLSRKREVLGIEADEVKKGEGVGSLVTAEEGHFSSIAILLYWSRAELSSRGGLRELVG